MVSLARQQKLRVGRNPAGQLSLLIDMSMPGDE